MPCSQTVSNLPKEAVIQISTWAHGQGLRFAVWIGEKLHPERDHRTAYPHLSHSFQGALAVLPVLPKPNGDHKQGIEEQAGLWRLEGLTLRRGPISVASHTPKQGPWGSHQRWNGCVVVGRGLYCSDFWRCSRSACCWSVALGQCSRCRMWADMTHDP